MIDEKGMTFDNDFGYSLPLFSSLLKKRGKMKKDVIAKIVIKGHAFLLDLFISIYIMVLSLNIYLDFYHDHAQAYTDLPTSAPPLQAHHPKLTPAD